MKRSTRPIRFAALLLTACATLGAGAQPLEDRDLERLSSDQFEDIKRARSAIIDVIDDPGLGVSQRLDASSQLIDPLETLMASGDELKMVNALMIAGSLITPEAMALIEDAYENENPGVRYAAVKALRSTFEVLGAQRTPSLQSGEVTRQIQTASEILKNDEDLFVAEGAARALISAAKMRDQRLTSAATRAFAALTEATTERLNSIDELSESEADGLIRIVMLADFELGRIVQSGPAQPSNDQLVEAGALAGDSLAYVYRRFEEAGRTIGSMESDDAAMLGQLVSSAENLLYSVQAKLGQNASRVSLKAAFDSGNDRDFNRGILTLIGGSGVLVQPPFSLESDRFLPSGG